MEKKGILIYLGIVFGVGWIFWLVGLLTGLFNLLERTFLQDVVFMASIFIPAVSAEIARAATGARSSRLPSLAEIRALSLRPVLAILIGIPILFALPYVVTTGFGWTEPQWGVGTLVIEVREVMNSMQARAFSPTFERIMPTFLLVLYPTFTLLMGVTVLALLAFGHEWGWRGYLLKQLAPQGEWKGKLLAIFLNVVWFVPLIVYWFISIEKAWDLLHFLPRYFILGLAVGYCLTAIYEATNKVILSALFLGVFFSQLQGIWDYLFPIEYMPWTGPFGIVSLVVWIIAAPIFPRLIARWTHGQEDAGETSAPALDSETATPPSAI